MASPSFVPSWEKGPNCWATSRYLSPFSGPATHLGLTLSCKAGAQDVHRMNGEGGHAGRQATADKVHGEVAGVAHAGSVYQLGQHFKRQKLQERGTKSLTDTPKYTTHDPGGAQF